ncbi:MAG: Helix-turn-helix domain [Acidobacteria bacterium]|nr:Helix-turn-helix domain [Acidobacteriota bacterium]
MTINKRPDDVDLRYGRMIRRLRLQRGWTVQQLADLAQYNPNHVSVIERGRNAPSLTSIMTFASIFGVDPRDILGEAYDLPPLTPPVTPAAAK